MQPAHTDVRHDPAAGRAHDLPGPAIEAQDLVQDLRALAAVAVAGLVLVPAAVAAFRATTR